MKTQMKVFLSLLSTMVLVLVSVLGAFASTPTWHAAAEHTALAGNDALLQTAACTKMKISNPALWFATDKKGNVYPDKIVKRYPTGTSVIASGFEYNCIPKNTTIGVVYYYGGFDTEPVFSDSQKQSPDNKSGVFWWYIGYQDGSPLPEGDWQVEWYINKKLASKGEITVGGGTKQDIEPLETEEEPVEEAAEEEPSTIEDIWDFGEEEARPAAETVTVQGKIIDGKTKKPIADALFVVLNPGVSMQEWAERDFAETDVYTVAQTDTRGQFTCPKELERNVTYTVVVAAKGYQMIIAEDFMVDEQQEDPVVLTIKMYK
ncbi:MAG: carboxypeptidase-like regulatory domain-containing protein [Anaerolineae bacterium]|nr:carboxypeptidase-like regulatory domain-containing protein [Anaerolineae bacterium]MDW8070138.1 carboxypeptidase-like regulatory domain-containing protein [Anaerolineae bacterium]